ncbi:sensor histidine kinase [Micromonospora eburnea]|uniref:histidine kinase n=1 Tax=Micromonospora eburnea TaxID=227316 RepID=A0A1C6UZI2_9ACTN|nr:histidine kinase [Micromonospora eburnea]SCL59419.1 Histidine kinase [Micromonospora eburnea]
MVLQRHSLLGWLRARWQVVVDLTLQVLLAGLFLLSGVATSASGAAVTGDGPAPALLPASLSALQILPLAVRRRAPGLVLAVVGLSTVAHVLVGMSRTVGYLPALLAIATAAERPSPLVRWGLCWTTTAAVAVASLPRRGPVEGALLAVVAFTVAWLAGVERGNLLRHRVALVEERTRLRLERRTAAADRAAAAARERLARQLHDTVAHTITVMVVQTEALLVTGGLTPAQRDRANRVLTAGRGGLTEIRKVVTALDTHASSASANNLTERLDQLRAAGLDVPAGPPAGLVDLPEPLLTVAHRLIGEAATNALRHSGPGTRLDIVIDRDAERISVSALSEPQARSRRPRPQRSSPEARTGDLSGYGLRSLAEDVEEYGGILRHGPLSGGGWNVIATFPAQCGFDQPPDRKPATPS